MKENSELLKEKEKLKQIIQKLDEEEINIQKSLLANSTNYQKDDYIRAYLEHLANKKIVDIRNIKPKPYFARIDFKENSDEEVEKLYIGKISIIDSETKEPLIIDWRAPISNLYYEGGIGKCSYEANEKIISGDILLKRQYFIENQKLEKILDIDKTAADQILQEALGGSADSRLKNIVATIQDEQNKIIRAPIDKPLIIQGVAGSGKTTIALHRIAYLIYKYEKNFNPENFMIIAPNRFFLNYISNVLPDLGVENVKQYTFEDFAQDALERKIKLADEKEKLITIVNKSFNEIDNGNIELILKESKFKSQIEFKYILDKYLEELEHQILPQNDFIISNIRIMRRQTMEDLFVNTYKNLPFKQRIEEIKKHAFSKIRTNLSMIIKQIENRRSLEIKILQRKGLPIEKEREERIKIFEKTEKILKYLNNEDMKVVDIYFNEINFKTSKEYYKDFISEFIYDEIDNKELAEYLIKNTLENIRKDKFAFEDLAPLIYIQNKIFGCKITNKLKHVIVDEAQDYGEFQFSVLKSILNSESMTILGDLSQGVHSYRGIENWNKFINVEFPKNGATYLPLSKTYRTTKEIIDIANSVIRKLSNYERENITEAIPVIRRPGSVDIYNLKDYDSISKKIIENIQKNKENNYKSIAIIGKDMKECKNIKKNLKNNGLEVDVIESKDSEYKAGINIIPSYLAKGLEFDYVIIVNADDKNYMYNSLDIKLLYVALTRAMSKLDIYYINNLTKLIEI